MASAQPQWRLVSSCQLVAGWIGKGHRGPLLVSHDNITMVNVAVLSSAAFKNANAGDPFTLRGLSCKKSREQRFDLLISQHESGTKLHWEWKKKPLNFFFPFSRSFCNDVCQLQCRAACSSVCWNNQEITLTPFPTQQSRMFRCTKTLRGDAESEMRPGLCHCAV